MSITYAMDTLTNPNPSDRQQLVKFLADRCKFRSRNNHSPRIEDVWYVIAVVTRWSVFSKTELPNFSRLALGKLAQDTFDCWTLMEQDGI